MSPSPTRQFSSNNASVRIYDDARSMGLAAADEAAASLRDVIARRGHARIIVGTGPSQALFIESLTAVRGVDWGAVEVFHMDEYVGMTQTHAASFRRWLREHVDEVVRPGRVHYLEGDAPSPEVEALRYGALLREVPVDMTFVGFGENGHIAFNDPPADFEDPLTVKQVTLDLRCRSQQVGEGHFPTIDSVPKEALTITCSAIMASLRLICCVPDRRKAEAVRNALQGPVTPLCPASLVRTHPHVSIYLDAESASLLGDPPIK